VKKEKKKKEIHATIPKGFLKLRSVKPESRKLLFSHMRYMILYLIRLIKQSINHNKSTTKFITKTMNWDLSNKNKIREV
jgi:hypothetical protein